MRLISPWSARVSRSRRIVSSETSKRALISVTVIWPSCLTRRRMSARRTAGSAESLWFCSVSILVMNAIRPARLASGCVAEPCEVILAEGLRLLRRNGDLDGLPYNGRFEDAEHDREAVERELDRAAVG